MISISTLDDNFVIICTITVMRNLNKHANKHFNTEERNKKKCIIGIKARVEIV